MSSGNSQKGTRMTIMVIEGLVGIAALVAGLLFIVTTRWLSAWDGHGYSVRDSVQ